MNRHPQEIVTWLRAISIATLLLAALGPSKKTQAQESEPIRVAVLTFESRTAYQHYKELGEDLAMLFTSEIAESNEIDLVERGVESVLWDERSLSLLSDSAHATLGNGRIVHADIIVRGRFASQDGGKLTVEIIDTINADILASHSFQGISPSKKNDATSTQFRSEFGAMAPTLLRKGIQRKLALRDQIRIAPLFFQNASRNRRLDHLEETVSEWMVEEIEKFPNVMPLKFGGHDEALDEQALALMGFSQSQPNRWQRIADYFIWGEFEELPSSTATDLDDLELKIQLRWLARDGREGALEVNKIRLGDFEAGMRRSIASLESSIITREQEPKPSSDVILSVIAKRVSDQLFERAAPLCPEDLHAVLRSTAEHHFSNPSYAAHLMQAACLLDPADKRKEFTRLMLRAKLSGSNRQRIPTSPVVCLRHFLDGLSWIERTASSPVGDDKMTASAMLLTVKEIAALLRSERDWSGEIEPYVSAVERGFEHSRKKLVDDAEGLDSIKGIAIWELGLRDPEYGQAIDWSSEQQARLLTAVWKILGKRKRSIFMDNSFPILLHMEREIGHQHLVSILAFPPPPEKARPVSLSTQAERTYRTYLPLGTTKHVVIDAPETIKFTPPDLHTVTKDFAGRVFIPEKIWRPDRHAYRVTGHLEKADATHRYISRSPGTFSLFIDLEKRQIRIDGPGVRVSYAELSNFIKKKYPNRDIADRYKRRSDALWSSDGKWCVGRTFARPVIPNRPFPVKKAQAPHPTLEKWTPASDSYRNLSPEDIRLLADTKDARALVDDRWLYLIGVGDERIRFNVLDLEADKIQWQTFEAAKPEFSLADDLELSFKVEPRTTPPVARLTSSGKWLMIRTARAAYLLRHGETELRSIAPQFATMFAHEREALRRDYAGSVDIRDTAYNAAGVAGRSKTETTRESFIEPKVLEQSLKEMTLHVEEITGADDGFYVLHSRGLSRISSVPDSGNDEWSVRNTRFNSRSLLIDPKGRTSWRSNSQPGQIGISGRYCLVAERSTSKTRLRLVERESGKYLGAVDFSKIKRFKKLICQQDICLIMGQKTQADDAILDLCPIVSESVSKLAKLLKNAEIPSKGESPPPAKFPATDAKPKPVQISITVIGEAISRNDVESLKRYLNTDRDLFHEVSSRLINAAIETSHLPTLRTLLESGADANDPAGNAPPWKTETEGGLWLHRPRLGLFNTPRPLALAAQRGDRAMVDLLIDYGAYAPYKDSRFRNAIDFAANDALKQHIAERCERQFQLEELLPVAADYIGKSIDATKTPEGIRKAFSDALNADPQLAYISLETGRSLLHALVAIEAKRAPRDSNGQFQLSDTLLPLVPELDFSARDIRGRNILAQELQILNQLLYRRPDEHFIDLALQLGCNPHIEDRFGYSAIDYLGVRIENQPSSSKSSIPWHLPYLTRLREKLLKVPH